MNKTILICQECGWDGVPEECITIEDDYGQDFDLCPNCWHSEFFEKELEDDI